MIAEDDNSHRFSEILVRWPLYLSQGPCCKRMSKISRGKNPSRTAAEIWSVVHFPLLAKHLSGGARGRESLMSPKWEGMAQAPLTSSTSALAWVPGSGRIERGFAYSDPGDSAE